MFEPFWVPALTAAAAAGGGTWVARDYLRRRLTGQEDRFMALFCQEDWDACNMDIVFHFDPEDDAHVKTVFRERLAKLVADANPATSLFHEVARPGRRGFELWRQEAVDLEDLEEPGRLGLRLVWNEPGRVRITWNHVQTDGVGLWDSFRSAFDPSPPLVGYRDMPTPPPFLPELLALPATLRRLTWRGVLEQRCQGAETRQVQLWPTAPIREQRHALGANFNLVSAAWMLERIFARHPDVPYLCTGLIVFFPFLAGRNRYGVLSAKVERDSVPGIVRQLERQSRFPLLRWGTVSTQTYTLGRLPELLFEPVMHYYRRQVDVLISNLPVGTTPALIDGFPVTISCHPWQLGAPYYVLAVGTRDLLHLSINSRFEEHDDFFAPPDETPSRSQ